MSGRSPQAGRAGRASTEPQVAQGLGHSATIPNADEIASALRLKALMDSIDAAGGKITVTFPDEGARQ